MRGNQAGSAVKAAAGKSQGNTRRSHAAQEERDHVRLQKERIRRLEADLAAKDRRIRELEQQSMVSWKLVSLLLRFTDRMNSCTVVCCAV